MHPSLSRGEGKHGNNESYKQTYFGTMKGSHMKRIVSGITPSGNASLHIGNYLGAVKQFKEMARDNECFLFVADFHALTTVKDKNQLRKNIETLILNELALLGDLKNITFFRQSDVPEHTQLSVILSNYTPLGLIKRAHAYKDKLEKDVTEDDINMGLFCYPILMAADILLYKPDLVPVGKDQKQHVEITRDIAGYFNRTYKTKTFPFPDAFIPEDVSSIPGTDGKRKMSKSLGNIISIFEDEDVIKKQVMACYTDPTRAHAHDPGHIEGNMVFTYLDFFGEKEKVEALKGAYIKGSISDIEVKQHLFESIMAYFADSRKRYAELKNNPDMVKKILEDGTRKASAVARQTIAEVRKTIGIGIGSSGVLKGKEPDGQSAGVITINEFARVDLRVGKVTLAENVEKSEKLIRLHVSFGLDEQRIIFTGVRVYGYTPDDFTGKQFFFVTNLQPRKMMGEESQGMILAVDSSARTSAELSRTPSEQAGKPLFVSADSLPIGAVIR